MKSLTKKLVFIGFIISALVLGTLLYQIPKSSQTKITSRSNNIYTQEEIKSSQFIPRNIRVAIYNEPNVTVPSYGEIVLHNDYDNIAAYFVSAGYQVSELTTMDISDHKLKTADYDVFVMVDQLPRENITNQVKEFWLGGGGILSFDSAASYLCYAGIIPPEAVGTSGRYTYWDYIAEEVNITKRHPVTKSYQLNDRWDPFSESSATFDWNRLQSSSIASDFIRLATITVERNNVSIIGLDPSNKGGRVVHMPGGPSASFDMDDLESLIVDAVDWLCPRPKGRIIFDLSHNPGYGLDPWDSLSITPGFYKLFRDNLVNRSYTIDKLYPSGSGNLTIQNLAKYDLLWIDFPNINFSENEVESVSYWINNGGGLLIIGDKGSIDQSKNINYLLLRLDLIINTTKEGTTGVYNKFEHPTVESCSQLYPLAPGLINYTGSAYPIWGNGPNSVIVAGQEYGNGRVVLIADQSMLRNNRIYQDDHLQYGINVVNWLTACDAKVLAFIRVGSSYNPFNDNPYRGAIANALNDLGYSFYLTFDNDFFAMSLAGGSWTLVVIDNYADTLACYSALVNYMKSGGRLAISTWDYRRVEGNALWHYLGFSYAGSYRTTPIPIYLWDKTHRIFNSPVDYNTDYLETHYEFSGTDWTNVTLYSNATAIAGSTQNPQDDTPAIILGANGRAITNTMQLSLYYDDTDNSTYPDAFEIWENEIAYLMSSIHVKYLIGGGGDDDDDDDDDEESIPFGNIYLIFSLLAVASLIIIHCRKMNTDKR